MPRGLPRGSLLSLLFSVCPLAAQTNVVVTDPVGFTSFEIDSSVNLFGINLLKTVELQGTFTVDSGDRSIIVPDGIDLTGNEFGDGVHFLEIINTTSPKISAFEGRTRNFVIPNVICRAGSSFAAASRGLILGFACFETYSFCFNVSSGLFFVCADSPPVLFTPADLLGPLPGRHRSQPFPGAEKIPHPFVPA